MSDSISQALVNMPSASRVLLQFNKISGVLTAVLGWVDPQTLNNDYYVYADVESFDYNTQEVVGTYPDYEIRDKAAAGAVLYERQLDLAAQQKITKAYPVINQVNNIGNAITELGRVMRGLLQEPDPALEAALDKLEEMNAYITEVKDANNERKAYYADAEGYTYVTIADEEQSMADQLEGGLHEVYGAKSISGGTVF
jgi:hypothetical protein